MPPRATFTDKELCRVLLRLGSEERVPTFRTLADELHASTGAVHNRCKRLISQGVLGPELHLLPPALDLEVQPVAITLLWDGIGGVWVTRRQTGAPAAGTENDRVI